MTIYPLPPIVGEWIDGTLYETDRSAVIAWCMDARGPHWLMKAPNGMFFEVLHVVNEPYVSRGEDGIVITTMQVEGPYGAKWVYRHECTNYAMTYEEAFGEPSTPLEIPEQDRDLCEALKKLWEQISAASREPAKYLRTNQSESTQD